MIRVLQKNGRAYYWTWVLKEASLDLMGRNLCLLQRKMWQLRERINGVMIWPVCVAMLIVVMSCVFNMLAIMCVSVWNRLIKHLCGVWWIVIIWWLIIMATFHVLELNLRPALSLLCCWLLCVVWCFNFKVYLVLQFIK